MKAFRFAPALLLSACLTGGGAVDGGGSDNDACTDDAAINYAVTWPNSEVVIKESGAGRSDGPMKIQTLMTTGAGAYVGSCFQATDGNCVNPNDDVVSQIGRTPVFVQGFQLKLAMQRLKSDGVTIDQSWSNVTVNRATVTTARFSFDSKKGTAKFSDVVTKDLLTGTITAGAPTNCTPTGDSPVGLDPSSHTGALTGFQIFDDASENLATATTNDYVRGNLNAGLVKSAGILAATPSADLPYRVDWVPGDFEASAAYARFGIKGSTLSSTPVSSSLTSGVLPYFGHVDSDVEKHSKVGSIEDRVIVGWCLDARKTNGSASQASLLYVQNHIAKPLMAEDTSTDNDTSVSRRSGSCSTQ